MKFDKFGRSIKPEITCCCTQAAILLFRTRSCAGVACEWRPVAQLRRQQWQSKTQVAGAAGVLVALFSAH